MTKKERIELLEKQVLQLQERVAALELEQLRRERQQPWGSPYQHPDTTPTPFYPSIPHWYKIAIGS
jgi:hypothetical protein